MSRKTLSIPERFNTCKWLSEHKEWCADKTPAEIVEAVKHHLSIEIKPSVVAYHLKELCIAYKAQSGGAKPQAKHNDDMPVIAAALSMLLSGSHLHIQVYSALQNKLNKIAERGSQ